MILGVHHAALAISDIEAAVAFYCDLIGLKVVMEVEVPACINVTNDALGLDGTNFKVRMIKKGNSCIKFLEHNPAAADSLVF